MILLHDKSPGEIRDTRDYPNTTKVVYFKPVANINREKLEAILLKSEIRKGCLLPPNLFRIVLKVLSRTMRHLKQRKGIQNGKEEAKVSLFADDMIIYISNPKILLGDTFNKVTGYKINPQRQVTLLNPNDKWTERNQGRNSFLL